MNFLMKPHTNHIISPPISLRPSKRLKDSTPIAKGQSGKTAEWTNHNSWDASDLLPYSEVYKSKVCPTQREIFIHRWRVLLLLLLLLLLLFLFLFLLLLFFLGKGALHFCDVSALLIHRICHYLSCPLPFGDRIILLRISGSQLLLFAHRPPHTPTSTLRSYDVPL